MGNFGFGFARERLMKVTQELGKQAKDLVYDDTLRPKKKLRDALKPSRAQQPRYCKKKEPVESEWERVQRMRKEGDPLIKGGRHHEPPKFNEMFENKIGIPLQFGERKRKKPTDYEDSQF